MVLALLKAQKKNVEYWINQFNGLRKTINIDKWTFGNTVEYMNIYTKEKSFILPDFWIRIFPKRNE